MLTFLPDSLTFAIGCSLVLPLDLLTKSLNIHSENGNCAFVPDAVSDGRVCGIRIEIFA